jgi:hypothetical protein
LKAAIQQQYNENKAQTRTTSKRNMFAKSDNNNNKNKATTKYAKKIKHKTKISQLTQWKQKEQSMDKDIDNKRRSTTTIIKYSEY